MNLLALDTSTEQISLALLVDGMLYTKQESVERQHAKVLLGLIEALFSDASKTLDDVDAIVYGRGPGSFTGLRVACSVAQGLAYAKDLPLYPVSSLLSIQNEFYSKEPHLLDRPVLSVIDARMQQLYWSYFGKESQEIKELVTAIDDIPLIEEAFSLVGVGFDDYLDALILKQPNLAQKFKIYPEASAMIRLVLAGKIKSCVAAKALPVYIRNQIIQGVSRG